MNVRRLLVLFFILGALTLSVFADAATYRLPIRTATLVVSLDHYQDFVNDEPSGPYELLVDSPSLRFGADVSSGVVYESAIIFDLEGIPGVADTSIASAVLRWTPVAAPLDPLRHCGIPDIPVGHPVPGLSDFNWQGGGYTGVVFFDPNVPEHDVSHSLWGHGYSGWILSTLGSGTTPVTIADPCVLVSTAPESSGICQ